MARSTGNPRNWTLRERSEARIESMKALRKPYEEDYKEIARLALPSKSEFMTGSGAGSLKRRANMSKQDTAGRIAGRTLVNGMATGLSSNYRPWFRVGLPDFDLMEFQPVKEHLHHVQNEIYWLFSKTNYYDANKVAYAQLGHMGTACNFGLEHPRYLAVWHPLEAMEYWLAQDDGLRTNACAREVVQTVDQLVNNYEWKQLSRHVRDAYDKGDVHRLVKTMNLVEYNRDRDADYWDAGNKEWRSIWWEVGCDSKKDEDLLRLSGFDTKPFSAPRWETTGAQVYSDSAPAWDALPDLRELEWMGRRYGRAMDNLVKPALGVPASLAQTALSLDPGSINFINELQGKVEPILKPDPNVLIGLEKARTDLTRRVSQLFYADLWMAITDMEGIQPKNEQELLYRNEEKLTQLGPVVDRVNIEKLEGDIDRAYNILQNLGRIRPAPKEMEGKGLQIEFISILTQAQKAAANTQIERIARFVGYLSEAFPEAGLKFDAQQAVDEFAQNTGVTPRIIRSDEIVAKLVEQQQQQMQQQQMMQAAPAARDGAQAAELLSRTQTGPDNRSMLDQMMGQ
jgi:hypothetical protein